MAAAMTALNAARAAAQASAEPSAEPSAGRSGEPTGRRPRALRVVGEVLLWPLAITGVLCALLAVLGSGLGFGVILFSTGSMSPAIPAGSAALVRTVDAADVRVGDVVTVDRGEKMPVTHRVVEVAAAAGSSAASPATSRTLTLQGDANAQPDPAPYEVEQVGRVVLSVPGVAPVVAQLGNPRVLGPLGVVAAGFVVWGLWPRSRHAGAGA